MHPVTIGAGLLGATTAWFLHKHGFYVTVLERCRLWGWKPVGVMAVIGKAVTRSLGIFPELQKSWAAILAPDRRNRWIETALEFYAS